MAALSICESLLIALVEKGVLRIEEAEAALEDAAAAHRNLDVADEAQRMHHLALQIVERLVTQMNAVDQSGGRVLHQRKPKNP